MVDIFDSIKILSEGIHALLLSATGRYHPPRHKKKEDEWEKSDVKDPDELEAIRDPDFKSNVYASYGENPERRIMNWQEENDEEEDTIEDNETESADTDQDDDDENSSDTSTVELEQSFDTDADLDFDIE